MKKTISLVLSLLMICSMLPFGAMAASREYSVTFVCNWPEGKEGQCRKMPTYGGDSHSETKLPIPSYVEGYTFEGWCEKSDLSDTPTKVIPPHTEGDKIFYAKWSKNGVSTNAEDTDGETLCEHTKFNRIYIDKSGKDQFAAELDFYYQCDSCGLYSESISGQNMIGDENALNEWLVKWYNDHIVSCRYIDVSLDDSGNVTSVEKIIDSNYFYPVNTNDTSWGTANDDTWYVCTTNTTVNNRIDIIGNVHLIIRDGFTLTAKNGIRLTEGNSLSVFAQSNGTGCGRLIANGYNGNAAIGGNAGLDISNPKDNNESYLNSENGGIFNVCGGIISAAGNGSVGIGGGNGYNGKDKIDHNYFNLMGPDSGGHGGNGGRGGTVNVYCGTVSASGSVGIGGGWGGRGGGGCFVDDETDKGGYRGNNGNGGNGGSAGILNVAGGSLTSSGERCAFGGGGGGAGGANYTAAEVPPKPEGSPGSAGGSGVLIIAPGCTVLGSANEMRLSISGANVSSGSILSEGSLWIVIAVVIIAVGGVAALVIVKKKKSALAGDAEKEDNE